MPSISWPKILPYLGAILAVVGLGWGIYHLGSNHGKAVIQGKWDHQKQIDAEFVAAEKAKINKVEIAHNDQDRKISDELSTLKQNSAALTATIRGDTALRLRDSAQRESLYRAASKGSAAERASLAGYAAQLDRSLSEGIGLVDELKATLEVRDGQLRQLGAQIQNDHQLINGSGDTNGQFEPAR